MIKRDFFETRNDGVSLYRTYSDKGHRIRQLETDNIFDEAIDVEDANYTYEETEEYTDDFIEIDEEVRGE